MKIHRGVLAGLAVGAAALAVSSCAYDPYYSGGSYSSYGGGYGDGYGYGGSSFSTSVFVGTGNSQWGYDPYAGAYYDYTRRAYYDPYLYGYYPVGYRPRYVVGSPHPHGWRRGNGYCAPPSRIRSHNLTDYHNRGEHYRGLGRDWSRDVQVSNPGQDQGSGSGGHRDSHDRPFGNGGSSHGDRENFTPQSGGIENGAGGRGGDRSQFGQGDQSRENPGFRGRPQGDPQFGNEFRGDANREEAEKEAMQDQSGGRGIPGQGGGEITQEPQFQPQPEPQQEPQFQPEPTPQIDTPPDSGGSNGGESSEINGLGEG